MRRDRIIILVVFSVLLMVRIVPALVLGGPSWEKPVVTGDFDQLLYLGGAERIVASGTNPVNYFPPLNFLFIAAFLYLGRGHFLLPTLAMIMVGWLTVMVIYRLAAFQFGKKVALVAAGISGLYPNFIFYGMTFQAETLAIFCIVWAFYMIVKFCRTSRFHCLAAGGVLWGVASMTRAGLHYFAPVLVLAILVYYPRGRMGALLKITGIFLLPAYLTIVAIGVLASPIHGALALDSKNGVIAAFHGANRISVPCTDFGHTRGNIFYDINGSKEQWPPGSQRYDRAILQLSAGRAYMILLRFIAQDPLLFLKNSFGKLSCFWSPNQYIIRHVKICFPRYDNRIINAVCSMTALCYIIVICGGLAGLGLSRDPLRLMVVLLILFYCVLIFLTVGHSRLRLPLIPFFMIYCAYVIAGLALRKVTLKKIFSHRCVTIIMMIFLCNSIFKFGEIILSPAEALVRRVELCNQLNFPKTVLFLLKENDRSFEYTDSQHKRMEAAREAALQQLALHAAQ